MTKLLLMSPPEREDTTRQRPVLSWTVFGFLVLFAGVLGFGGDTVQQAIARFAANLAFRWEQHANVPASLTPGDWVSLRGGNSREAATDPATTVNYTAQPLRKSLRH